MENPEVIEEFVRANEELANLMRNTMSWRIETTDDLDAFTRDLDKVKYALDYAKQAAVREVSFT